MLPVTQASLMSRMHVTTPTYGVSTELARYLRNEYGADAAFAGRKAVRANGTRLARIPNGTQGLVRRFLAMVAEALTSGRPSPGGA